MRIDVGGGASMAVDDRCRLQWALRYDRPNHQTCVEAATVLASYDYLLTSDTTEEAIRRLRIMRRAIMEARHG